MPELSLKNYLTMEMEDENPYRDAFAEREFRASIMGARLEAGLDIWSGRPLSAADQEEILSA